MLASSNIRCLRHFRWLANCNHQIKKSWAVASFPPCPSQGTNITSPLKHTSLFSGCTQTCHSPVNIRYLHGSNILYTDEIRVIVAPPFAESVTEGDIKWGKAIGDSVEADEVVGEIETDKTNMPVHAPAAGVIEELLVKDGETVNPGKQLFKLRVGAGGGAAPKKEAAAPSPVTEAPKPQPAAPSSSGPIPDRAPPPPVKPAQPLSSVPVSAVKPKPAPSAGASAAPAAIGGSRSEQRVKMNRMRQRIAQRLKEAQNTCAMLTTFNEIDMSNVMEMRNKYKDAFQKKYNLKLGFMSAFVKASAFALADQPVVNAVIDDMDIVYRDYIDISVAVATPKGLVVPVIRNVEQMNYADIEKVIADLGERARAGTLAIEDMDGGTFTISNGGVFGSMFGTPIINPPQSAILGMHGIFDRPVAINGKVEVRPMMYVALTYDHKLIDGREAVTFLKKVKSAVEDPRTILLHL
ncbi:dihydrolipoyllysine-residue succinyltransferase component of 2-oxoglutarate dehydrogenase cmplx mito [Biomphalaria pfeifferi]|uniref:Dihydrolipoyllysine-residue succinyltransferase component of 2-oxoglutarate dehydrogenase complex, mitochondrial n=1 Tax=Biomphalaria pfeifferi TaxID=112525 RepID=A0AAD8BQX1_BIOPF|nr:dihydrolipoyllysine-residue succinyltransferase component of 2-oxoglutarate dehydrogenase cmplx mito [Biomphalaria pfeifferi]